MVFVRCIHSNSTPVTRTRHKIKVAFSISIFTSCKLSPVTFIYMQYIYLEKCNKNACVSLFALTASYVIPNSTKYIYAIT